MQPKTIPFDKPKTIPFAPAPVATPTKSTFTERVDTVIQPRVERIQEIGEAQAKGEQGGLRSFFQVAGQYAGAAGDAAFEGIKTVTPEIVKKPARAAMGFLQKGINVAADKISDIPAVQEFAQTPASKSLERDIEAVQGFSNFLPAPKGLGALNKGIIKTVDTTGKVIDKVAPRTHNFIKKPIVGTKETVKDIFVTPADELKARRVTEGYLEQNKRLKTAENAHNENTKVYKEKDAEGNVVERKVSPVDTLAKYNITPVVEKGGLNMGDYRTGTGALGRIKEEVAKMEEVIEKTIEENSSPTGIKIDDFKSSIESKIRSNPKLKRSGKIETTIQKLEKIIDDYKNSYGDTISEKEINAIRKVMNQDWDLETMDLSRVIGDTARDIVYNVTPNQAVKKMLLEQGELMGAKNYAETINNTKVTGGRLGNMFLRTTGAMLGSTLDRFPFVGAILGMLGGEYAARALQQSQFKTLLGETKSLFQQSNKSQPTNSANSTAKSSIPSILPSKIDDVVEGKVDKISPKEIDEFIGMKIGDKIENPIGTISITDKVQFTRKSFKHFIESRLKDGNTKEDIHYLVEKAPEVVSKPELKIPNTNQKDYPGSELLGRYYEDSNKAIMAVLDKEGEIRDIISLHFRNKKDFQNLMKLYGQK